MVQSDRGLHPDLLDETVAEREAAEQPSNGQNTGGRSRRRTASSASTEAATPPAAVPPVSADGQESGGESGPQPSPDSAEAAEAPDWRTAQSDEEAFKLLAKKLPSDVLQKDETLSGLIGSRADLRARDIIRQQQRDQIEQQKRDAAANNDLYTLGELTQREYQQAIQAQQGDQYLQPFMQVVQKFQAKLPQSVQEDVAGKVFGAGQAFDVGFEEYLSYVVNSATKLGVEAGLRERESALRKSILSEINGTEPVPEREGGTPSRVRVVTDEQIAAMSLAEYDALFDENGHPRPGVQHRSTRGIPIQRR